MTLVTQPRKWIALAALFTGLRAGSVAAAPVAGPETTTPIRHLVVLFQENVSFDHYFATYPHALTMSDNSYSTVFGPSTPGALNLISGQTHGFTPDLPFAVTAGGTVFGDPQPTGDICDTRDPSTSIDPNNRNIGDLLNAKH